jgi:hypothetical protein
VHGRRRAGALAPPTPPAEDPPPPIRLPRTSSKRPPTPSQPTQITDAWLRQQQAAIGRLYCEYCGDGPLRIYRWDEAFKGDDMATVDHGAWPPTPCDPRLPRIGAARGGGPLAAGATAASDPSPAPATAVVPRAQGGADHPSNFKVACRRCNGAKGARTPAEWQPQYA